MLNTDKIRYPVESQPYKIPDRIEELEFTGRMIGKASTQRGPGDLRWTDITIYVTEGGKYIIQKEGISLVYHRAEASCRGGELTSNEKIKSGSVPCPDCRPPDLEELRAIRENLKGLGIEDPAQYRREVTMSSAEVTDDPHKIVPLAHWQGRLTMVATEAIRRASENDERLRKIFRVRTVA